MYVGGLAAYERKLDLLSPQTGQFRFRDQGTYSGSSATFLAIALVRAASASAIRPSSVTCALATAAEGSQI
jgi:hypothetical protein